MTKKAAVKKVAVQTGLNPSSTPTGPLTAATMFGSVDIPFFFDFTKTRAVGATRTGLPKGVGMLLIPVRYLHKQPHDFRPAEQSIFSSLMDSYPTTIHSAWDGSVILRHDELCGSFRSPHRDRLEDLDLSASTDHVWCAYNGALRDALAHLGHGKVNCHGKVNLLSFRQIDSELSWPLQSSLLGASMAFGDAWFTAGVITAAQRQFNHKFVSDLTDKYHLVHRAKHMVTLLRDVANELHARGEPIKFLAERVGVAVKEVEGGIKPEAKQVRTVSAKPKTPARKATPKPKVTAAPAGPSLPAIMADLPLAPQVPAAKEFDVGAVKAAPKRLTDTPVDATTSKPVKKASTPRKTPKPGSKAAQAKMDAEW